MAFLPMFSTAIKNLFKKPATRLYPFEVREPFARTRGNVTNNVSACIFCGVCKLKCPAKALEVDRVAKTWTIDRLKCVICGRCVEVCPKKCLTMNAKYPAPDTARAGYVEKCTAPAAPPAQK
jgi:formate hydrogenlyase subunit 6/NADH:ubiquinone oxidoreductase subunit I